jgi:hypothetical protein
VYHFTTCKTLVKDPFPYGTYSNDFSTVERSVQDPPTLFNMARMRTLPAARAELAAKANTSLLGTRSSQPPPFGEKRSFVVGTLSSSPQPHKNQADYPTNSINPNKKRCSCLQRRLVNSSSTSSRPSRHRHRRLEASQDSPRHEPWRPPSLRRRHGTNFRRHHHHGSPPRTIRLISTTSSTNSVTSAGTSRLRRRPSLPSN